MEILALHFLELESNTQTTTAATKDHRRIHIDTSDSNSPVPGVDSDAADAFAFIYGVVGPTIVTFGLIGNILILFVVGRSRMEGAIPVYLSALALSDMGALLSSIPLWIRLAQKVACSHWSAFYYGHLELFILNTFMAASIFNVVALTIGFPCRYTSVCLAGQFPKIHTPLRAKMAVAISFLLALIVSLPLCILKYVVVHNEEEQSASDSIKCRYEYLENKVVTAHPLWTAYVWLGESLVRFLPGLILATLNMLILIKYHGVVKTRRQMRQGQPNADLHGSGRSNRNLEQERKLLTLLLSIIVLFFITNIPSAVLSIIYDQELESSHSFQVFRAVANLLEMSNFALNFCMYFLCSKEFRKMLYKAMPQCGLAKFFILSSTSSSQSSNPQTCPVALSGSLNNHPS